MGDDLDVASFRTRSADRFVFTSVVRYGDLDPNGHVNHMRYLAYLEECRLAHRRQLDAELDLPSHLGWPVGGLTIRYLMSLLYPGEAIVEAAPIRIGRTSFTLGYGIFSGQDCVALAYSQSVCLDNQTGRTVPLPKAVVEKLTATMEP